jgi:hypothetical protein
VNDPIFNPPLGLEELRRENDASWRNQGVHFFGPCAVIPSRNDQVHSHDVRYPKFIVNSHDMAGQLIPVLVFR